MSFVVSARKYRPTNFDELIGQDHIASTLKNAIRNDKLAHAFLFSGPRGVGKTTSARILAKVLNCENLSEDFHACGECSACKAFQDNASFNIFELDAASNNSVEHIRSLNDQVRFQPQQGSFKIYIIDEVHMLTTAAFNAFLKTLEEPPPYAKFILATTEKHKILPTILSRCQVFDFRRIQVKDIVIQLQKIADKESRKIDDEALHLIAQKADGAMRDALSIYDRIASSVEGDIDYVQTATNLNVLDHDYYFKVVDLAIKEDLTGLMLAIDEIIRKGFEPEQFVLGLMEHLRQLLLVKDVRTAKILEVGDSLMKRYEQQAVLASADFLLTALSLLERTDMELVRSQNKRLSIELVLSKIAFMNRVEAPPVKKKLIEKQAQPAPPSSKRDSKEVLSIDEPLSGTLQVKSVEPKVKPPEAPITETPESKTPKKEATKKPKVQAAEKAPKVLSEIVGKESLKKKTLTPNIVADIDNLVAQIAEQEAAIQKVNNPFTSEFIQGILTKWQQTSKSKSFKAAVANLLVETQENTILIKSPSEIFVDMIKQESELIQELHELYPNRDLSINFSVDRKAFPDYEPPKKTKFLSTIDKYDRFKRINPEFENFVKQLDLKPRN